jgi:hypothetical protein
MFRRLVYETDQLQEYTQLFGFASLFLHFLRIENKADIFRLCVRVGIRFIRAATNKRQQLA